MDPASVLLIMTLTAFDGTTREMPLNKFESIADCQKFVAGQKASGPGPYGDAFIHSYRCTPWDSLER